MDKHISCVVKSYFLQLHEFHLIRSFIPKFAAITFTNAFKQSYIDYCNSLFCGLPRNFHHRLQKVQNTVTHIQGWI